MTNTIPRLCGGTFLTLVLQAIKPHNRSHVTIKGGRIGLSNANVFRALITIFDPTSYIPNDKSFNTMTSKYKNCNKIGDAYFRYEDTDIISHFNQEVRKDYQAPLSRMKEFVETYIDIETPAKSSWLVRAILELIVKDPTITNDTSFYIEKNGSALTKTQLGSLNTVAIESFLLGIWHFIIMNRPDNTVGKATVDNWHALPTESNAQRAFTSKIGKQYRPDLKVSRMTDISEFVDKNDDPGVERIEPKILDKEKSGNNGSKTSVSDFESQIDEPEVEIIEPEILDNDKSRNAGSNEGAQTTNTYNQTMNVFNQFGNGNTQIGNVGTFINK